MLFYLNRSVKIRPVKSCVLGRHKGRYADSIYAC